MVLALHLKAAPEAGIASEVALVLIPLVGVGVLGNTVGSDDWAEVDDEVVVFTPEEEPSVSVAAGSVVSADVEESPPFEPSGQLLTGVSSIRVSCGSAQKFCSERSGSAPGIFRQSCRQQMP